MTIQQDSQGYAPSALITLFELDATVLGGTISRFHPGLNQLSLSVVWQGNSYQQFPIEAIGFEATTDGPVPRPTVRISNVTGIVGALVRQYKGLVGAKFTRKRTLLKYLDAVNFTGGVNPTADPNQHYLDDIWFVNRKTRENKELVEFELVSPLDLQGLMLPRRQITQSCSWRRYRGPECSYAGPPVADENDAPTTLASKDSCGRRLTSCELRFGVNKPLPFGGFPGAGTLR